MKKILYLLAGATSLAACQKDDFLDPKTNGLTEQSVFSDSIRTMAFANRLYGDIGYSFNKQRWAGGNHGTAEQATDDYEYSFSGTGQSAVILYSGTYSALNLPSSDFWDLPWANIRRCNLLLSKLPETPLSGKLRARLAGEARFMRVWYYYSLVSQFGGVPLIGDKVYGTEDFIDLPRNSFAECISYMTSELDATAQLLPNVAGYPAADYGRVTKGACLALKSRILLYAASPLFNGGAISSDPSLTALVSYPTASTSHWQAAADAAQAVISSGEYSLVVDNTTPGRGFVSVFLTRVNPEYIFFVNRNNKDLEYVFLPSERGGVGYFLPTHNLAEAFPMKNGKAITDPTSGYDPRFPYRNRDPRFDNSLIYNGAVFATTNGNSAPLYTYEGAQSGFTAVNTGYFLRKMLDPTISNQGGTGTTQRGWPLIRYAEVLLNYAEAINEVGQTEMAVQKLIEIRSRGGIDAGTDGRYGIKAGISQSEARDLIRNDRRIELAAEDHRWNDIRRWKIAEAVNNGYNKKIRITLTGTLANPTWTYNPAFSLRRHSFRPEMYLMPIPDAEIRKVPKMRQNPGW